MEARMGIEAFEPFLKKAKANRPST